MSTFTRCTIIGAALAAALFAQDAPTVKKVPVRPSSPVNGKEMFQQYCAPCHGLDGKGAGPAASSLKKTPADLTMLSGHNNGKFPETRVQQSIRGDAELPAHGSKDMPVWGTLFRELNHEPGMVQMRVSNLTKYVHSMQAK